MSLKDKKNTSYNAEKRRKIKEIKDNELNKQCFDCSSCNPEYISINNGVFICKDCLINHNKFPKQISTTLKNNLSSLNSKELEFMYLGGNQNLLEFINYEYPFLQKFKINILYQTKAMQYYRNNLYYIIYGGPKPIKPNEKINAYELVDANDLKVKNEKINLNQNNKIKKINNKTPKQKRNKSAGKGSVPAKKKTMPEKTKVIKIDEEKRNNYILNTNNETSLKRHRSFYKEMYKLFGPELNNDIDSFSEENSVYKKQKIKRNNQITKRKSDFGVNRNKNKFIAKTNENIDNSKLKKCKVENIYNNNYYTLSATKNIFMFTPNRDNLIYQHRKINDINNQNNNPDLNIDKEIYYKPKVPYLINSNRSKDNKNIIFPNEKNENAQNEINNIIPNNNIQNNLNTIKSINTYTIKNSKLKQNEIFADINIKKNNIKDDNDIRYNEKNNLYKDNYNYNYNNNEENENINNEIFTKKKLYKINKNEKDKNLFNLWNNNKITNLKTYNNKTTELKEIKIEKLNRGINNNFDGSDGMIYNNNFNEQKNKTYIVKKEIRRRRFNKDNKNNNVNINNTDINLKNSIKIDDGNDRSRNNPLIFDNKDIFGYNTKKEIKKENSYEINNNKIKTIEYIIIDRNNNNNNKNILEKKIETKNISGKKDILIDNNNNKNEMGKEFNKDKNKMKFEKVKIKEIEINKIEEDNKKKNNNLGMDKPDSRRIYKKTITEDNKKTELNKTDNHSSNYTKNDEKYKIQEGNNNNNKDSFEPKKFSIRNKYKLKRLNELGNI